MSVSVVVALLTPFADDGRVDLGAAREHVAFLVAEGVDALMPGGTTGEGPLLDDAEIEALVGACVEAADGRAQVLAHVGRAATNATVNLARRVVAAGADAISAVVPYYYAFGDDALGRHYETLLDALPNVPVHAYTIPVRTGNELSAESVRRLAAAGLAGVKDSTKSLQRHLEYLEATRGTGCAVLMGSDGLVADAFRAGAGGCVSAIANLRPDLLVKIKAAHLDGDVRAVDAAQQEVLSLRAALASGPPLAAVKRATAGRLAERGCAYPTALRAPLGFDP